MNADGCFHCGLPIPANSAWNTQIDGVSRQMCCPACATVAALIAGSGLSAYYLHRDSPADKPGSATDNGSFAIFDEPEAQSEFVIAEDQHVWRAQLAIDGIHCAACVWLIEQHLSRHSGIESVTVNLAEHRASIRWRPALLPLSQVMALISGIGYSPRPFLPSGLRQSLQTENRQALRRLGVAGIVQMQIGMFAIALYAGAFEGMEVAYRDYLRWASLILCLPVVLYSAAPFFSGALRGLQRLRPGMDLPVALAIGLAFLSSVWFTLHGGGAVYFDSVAMFTFLLLGGRYLEMRARHDAALASGNALALLPAAATRLIDGDARSELVPVGRLRPGDSVLIRPGETLPVDGLVYAGASQVDESSLSGESFPIPKGPGDKVSAGSLNIDGSISVTVQTTGLNSRLGAILNLVDRAQAQKPRSVEIADRAASVFTLLVLLLAACTALYWMRRAPSQAFEIVLSVLVVSCPCALSLATPTALTSASTALKKMGFLITRSHALAALAEATTVVWDKTGTLGSGDIELQETRQYAQMSEADCLQIACSLEACSEHPIARAFTRLDLTRLRVSEFRASPGKGIEGRIAGTGYRIGHAAYVAADVTVPGDGKWVFLGDGIRTLAAFRLADSLRPDALSAVRQLRQMGIESRLLSGDDANQVGRVAAELGLEHWRADCSPEQKLEALRSMQACGQRLIMVGDGINDVPVLAGADVSIAVANASDVTRASADCMLLAARLNHIPLAIDLARKTRRIIHQNLAWALFYNLFALPFAAAGLVPPWLAAIGMSTSSLVVVANASRLRKHAATD